MDPSATWIQVVQVNTLARQQVKMQQHTMLQESIQTLQIVDVEPIILINNDR